MYAKAAVVIMNIVILGSTGYLGQKLVSEFANNNNEVLGLTHRTHPGSKAENVHYIPIDELEQYNKSVDVVINCSCKYMRYNYDNTDIISSNLKSPMTTLEWAITHKVPKYITIGTGLPDDFNIYCITKKAFADIGKYYVDNINARGEEKFTYYNILLENYYGPDEPGTRFIPNTLDKLLNNEPIDLTSGTQMRDFIYIDDVVQAIVMLSSAPFSGYHDIPLGSGYAPRLYDFITEMKLQTHSESRLNFGSVPFRVHEPNCVADESVMRAYGIQIRYQYKAGIEKMIRERKKCKSL